MKPGRSALIIPVLASLFFAHPSYARNRTPLPDDAYDGGVFNAETLGRGNTIASTRGSPSSPSENPAALANSNESAIFGTALIRTSTNFDTSTTTLNDPTSRKVLHYLSLDHDHGAFFFEPLGRRRETQSLAPSSSRDVDFSANAFGFSGATKMGSGGGVGVSIAYLWSSLATADHEAGQPDQTRLDTGEGLRVNFGVRFPTGPTMWGFVLQDAPGFIFWKDYRRDQLPVRARVGNTWRVLPGLLLSLETERRFYHEGGHEQQYYYVGDETYLGSSIVARVGSYGTNLDRAEERHLTGGLTFIDKSGYELSYALDVFQQDGGNVRQSFLSFKAPIQNTTPENSEMSP